MNCPTCGAGMKMLFTGFFCPNDCDRIPKKGSEGSWIIQSAAGERWEVSVNEPGTRPPPDGGWRGFWVFSEGQVKRYRADDRFSDFHCRLGDEPGWDCSEVPQFKDSWQTCWLLIFRRAP